MAKEYEEDAAPAREMTDLERAARGGGFEGFVGGRRAGQRLMGGVAETKTSVGSPILAAQEELQASMESLAKSLHNLEERLSPVLGPPPPPGEISKEPAEPEGSNLLQWLHLRRREIVGLARIVGNMTDRLEV